MREASARCLNSKAITSDHVREGAFHQRRRKKKIGKRKKEWKRGGGGNQSVGFGGTGLGKGSG